MTPRIVIAALGLSLAVAACEAPSDAPRPSSDSGVSFAADARAPVDDHLYTLDVEVLAAPSSITRQTSPGSSSLSGTSISGIGSVSGYSVGPTYEGKGYLRVHVLSRAEFLPESVADRDQQPADWFGVGDTVIVKTTDTKAAVLAAGDRVTLRCRADYEAVAALRTRESFNATEYETWELDLCRLMSPVVTASEAGG